ncbi:hypothetical protein FMEXI_1092 [Fusarium mexicanum]|uniref:BTB domain-containing protein n=1 Tax=Fusarium mexicanum TaxID=751941 RepID=A0A8H5JJP2_9HYPO|nr:hypothetical protein FMEXI_1092 [Fusarium mexicanum]
MDDESENFREGLWQHNQEFTDFTFICGAVQFPVHKVIVCSQSKVFHAACTGPFKESSTNEFDLSESSVDHVTWLIDFLYKGAYGVESSKDSTLADHIYMFAMGDMYGIEPLAQYAAEQFRTGIYDTLNLQDILALIPKVYNSPPEHRQELRKQVVEFVKSPFHRNKEEIDAREWYDDMAEQCPDFIKDLLLSFFDRRRVWLNDE